MKEAFLSQKMGEWKRDFFHVSDAQHEQILTRIKRPVADSAGNEKRSAHRLGMTINGDRLSRHLGASVRAQK